MKKLIKAGLILGLLLLFAGNVWALPIEKGGISGANDGKDYISNITRWLYASYFDHVFDSLIVSLGLTEVT
ncbi:MAG: hypothetical protein DRH93_20570, partial [Deltaproteobacteria bacterium]